MGISNAIEWLRKERGLKFKDISDVAHIGLNQPSRIERGDISPTYDTIYRIVDGINITERELHKFAHLAFDIAFPLESEPEDPLVSELLGLLDEESRDFKRGMLFALRLHIKGGDATAKQQPAKTGHG